MLNIEGLTEFSQLLCVLGLSLLIPLVRGPGCRLEKLTQFQETNRMRSLTTLFSSLLDVCILFLKATY